MTPLIGTLEFLLDTKVNCVHYRPWSYVYFTFLTSVSKNIAEVSLAETVSSLVKRHRFDIKVGVNGPREIIIVIRLTEGGVRFFISVNICWITRLWVYPVKCKCNA